MLSLISQQDDIDKIYLYVKDLSETKYEFLIKKREDARTKHLNDLSAFIECSNTMDDIYENIDDYNPSRKRKVLLVFDDMIADIMINKKFQDIIKEQRIEYFTCVYHSVLFFCSKRCQIKFNTLFDYEN